VSGGCTPIDPPVAVGGVTVGAVDGRVVAVVDGVEVVVVAVAGAVLVVVDEGVLVVGVCAPAIAAVPPNVAAASARTSTTRIPRRVGTRGWAAPPGEEAKRTG
jgi:hypothetical protein